MPHHHILPVGISLLTNFARERNLPVNEAAKRNKAIAEFLRADPRKASAEINSLDSRTRFLSRANPDLAVTLVFTTTGLGKSAKSFLEKELKFRNVAVTK